MARSRLLALLWSILVLVSTPTLGQTRRSGDSQRHYIVQVHRSADAMQVGRGAALRTRGRLGHVYRRSTRGFSIELPAGMTRADILTQPGVVRVEPDIRIHAVAQTLPTGIDRIDVDRHGTIRIDGADDQVDVDIAIIDTGIDVDHPDLRVAGGRRFYVRGWWSLQDDQYDDGNGHGTHCAGIAAAIDNDLGVVGVAPGARLWAVRVLDSSGEGYLSDLIAGIDWVTEHADTIEVANLSLSGTGKSDILREAIQNSVNAGVVYVVAAGNDGIDIYGPDGVFDTSDDTIPAAYPEVATISAMVDTDGKPGGAGPASTEGEDDAFAGFSNVSHSAAQGNPVNSPGAAIDLMMPGVNIRSCWAGARYATGSGTSMASPHAAGLAALYIADHGRAYDASGVYAIRQALIDAGADQAGGNRLASPGTDSDGHPERLGWAGSTAQAANRPPEAAFAFNAEELSVGFSDQSTDSDGKIVAWDWDFDDGERSTDRNPNHTYSSAGMYTVQLTVTDDSGDTDTVFKEISVSGPANQTPTADFSFETNDLSVSFIDRSTDKDGTIKAWYWDFGDGSTSNAQNPDYDYATGGTYTVTLTVTDNANATNAIAQNVTVTASASQTPTAYTTIEMSIQRWWTIWRVTAEVTVADGSESIAEADVSGHWEGPFTSSVSGSTRSDGSVVFRSPWLRTDQDVVFVIDSVSKDGQDYALSGQTSGTISAP